MLKSLIKKQLLEINRGFFVDGKTGKSKSKKAIVGYGIFFAAMILILFGFFFFVYMTLSAQFAQTEYMWLYFTIAGSAAIMLGIFGSVFNTFATLYQAKDNDLLLSMPIPVKYILVSRLAGVYVTGAFYSGAVYAPALLAYYIFGSPSWQGVIGSLILFFTITVFVLVASCVLGYVVAKINQKLRNKSFFTVLISVVFIAVYYFIFAMSEEIINEIVSNGSAVASGVKLYAYPLYIMGKSGDGDFLFVAISVAASALILLLTYAVLNKSFLKIATSSLRAAKVKSVKDKDYKQKSVRKALIAKEFRRFVASPIYMLNCGIGLLIAVALGVAALIFHTQLSQLTSELSEFIGDRTGIIVAGVTLFALNIATPTAVSVSLEGKNYWILRSSPIKSIDVLKAKIYMQDILFLPCGVFAGVCILIAANVNLINAVAVMSTIVSSVLFFSRFELMFNLKFPNLNFTNETVVVKQSSSVMFSTLTAMAYDIVFMAGGIMLSVVPGWIFCLAVTAMTVMSSVIVNCWIKKKGTKIYESLA